MAMKRIFFLLTALVGHCLNSCDVPHETTHFTALPVAARPALKGDSPVLEGPAVFASDDHFVWGASPIKTDDGNYYLVYAAFEAGEVPFTTAWVTGSQLGLAVSDRPDGNFRQLGIFYNKDGYREDNSRWDAQSVHNPHLRRFGDKYYLYYIGTSDAGNETVKSATGTLDRRSRLQQSLQIGVIEFESFRQLLDGDFRPGTCILSPRTRVKDTDIVRPSPEGTLPKPDNIIVVNPSVVFRPSDGKYLLYFKGNIYDPHWRGIHGVAIGDSPTGPFTAQDEEVFTIETPDHRKLSAEDPYVWYHPEDRRFYAVFKDFTGDFTKAGPCLAWMQSADGIHWELPEHSLFMKKEIVLTSGDTLQVDRLERPQLLLDEQGNPTVLFAACSVGNVNGKTDGSSFNLQIPIRTEKE